VNWGEVLNWKNPGSPLHWDLDDPENEEYTDEGLHLDVSQCPKHFDGGYTAHEKTMLSEAASLSKAMVDAYEAEDWHRAYQLFLVASSLNEEKWRVVLDGSTSASFNECGLLVWLSHAREINAIGREAESRMDAHSLKKYSQVSTIKTSLKDGWPVSSMLDKQGHVVQL
jgi:hypothetical protein